MKKISQKTKDGLILRKNNGNKSELPPAGHNNMNKKNDKQISNNLR
jgi:hypothetical protein